MSQNSVINQIFKVLSRSEFQRDDLLPAFIILEVPEQVRIFNAGFGSSFQGAGIGVPKLVHIIPSEKTRAINKYSGFSIYSFIAPYSTGQQCMKT